jgi:hypothetical protein
MYESDFDLIKGKVHKLPLVAMPKLTKPSRTASESPRLPKSPSKSKVIVPSKSRESSASSRELLSVERDSVPEPANKFKSPVQPV